MPSRSNSASARRTLPGEASAGNRSPSTTPRGSRAPGARHVHVPSSRLLVSSMSILRAMPSDNATNDGGEGILDGTRSGLRLSAYRPHCHLGCCLHCHLGCCLHCHLLCRLQSRLHSAESASGTPRQGGGVRQGPRCPYPGTVAWGTLRLDAGGRQKGPAWRKRLVHAMTGAAMPCRRRRGWTTTAAPDTVAGTPRKLSRPPRVGGNGRLNRAVHTPGRPTLAARRGRAIIGTQAVLLPRSPCSEPVGARVGGRGAGPDPAVRDPRSPQVPTRPSSFWSPW
jgi:hypothetical protein